MAQATDGSKTCQDDLPPPGAWSRWTSDLFAYGDSCHVWLLRSGERAIVIDAGTGAWFRHLAEVGVRHVDAVVLTHAHRDQVSGLYRQPGGPFPADLAAFAATRLIAPAEDADLLDGDALTRFWRTYQANGCPPCYAAPARPVDVDGTVGGDSELQVGGVRLCAVPTPGHTRGAMSYIVAWHGRQLAFCGDALRGDGTVHEPYHLEWDHWTPEGALAAWYGLQRLAGNRIDLLLPAHGPVARRRARGVVAEAQRRLLDWVRAKTAVAPGAASRWVDGEPAAGGALRLSEHLYAFGGNGFLLTSRDGRGLVVDPTRGDLAALEALLAATGITPEVATASHYHVDHTDALDDVRVRHGARVWLHPWVAAPIRDRNRLDVPWLPAVPVVADRLLPETGRCRWREYGIDLRPFPGQTWWHCAFDTEVDGRHVLFSGDNFQPPTRWNGTGGFCAYNGSRFADGFARSAQVALDLAPDLVCNGHRCIYAFDAGHYRRILAWCARAEQVTRQLCGVDDAAAAGATPAGTAWHTAYDPRRSRLEPFVTSATDGVELELSFVHTNHRRRAVRLVVRPVAAAGFTWTPAQRRLTVPAGGERRARFRLRLQGAARGRHVLAADVEEDGRLRAEAAAALVDVV